MLPKLIQDRKLILQEEKVVKCLCEIDLLITEKSTNSPIKTGNKEDVFETLVLISKNITKDVGIKSIEEYDIIRFADIITKYYSKLSISEIKLAFELLLIGELDKYLPLGKNGSPDKNHYQVFSFEYISKVLRAYIKRKDRTWLKVNSFLPKLSGRVITGIDKKSIRNDFTNIVLNSFVKYRDTGKRTEIMFPAYWIEFFRKKGMINIEINLDIFTLKEAYKLILNKSTFVTDEKRCRIINDYEKGIINNDLQSKCSQLYYFDIIYKFYDFVIKNKKQLKDLI